MLSRIQGCATAPSALRRSLRLKIHRHAVDAIAQVRRRRAVLEYVAEMAAAAAAMHLGADHAVARVGRGLDSARHRVVEARPAGAALEFLLRHEQRLPAAGAAEGPGALLVIERTAAGRLGAVPAQHLVLLGRQQAPPLGFAVADPILLVGHVRAPQSSRTTPCDRAARSTPLLAPG